MADNKLDSQVVKDLSEEYANKISRSIDIIHGLCYDILMNPERIIFINLELHDIFKKIYPKLKKHKQREEIDKQLSFQKKLSRIRPITRERMFDKESNSTYIQTKRTKRYGEYKEILEEREMHINECLERLGLLSKEVKKDTRLR